MFYKEMSLRNVKEIFSLKCLSYNFWKLWFFLELFKKLQNWVNFNFFSYLEFFFVSIIRKWRLLLVKNLIK